jgi:hypothetical protein
VEHYQRNSIGLSGEKRREMNVVSDPIDVRDIGLEMGERIESAFRL